MSESSSYYSVFESLAERNAATRIEELTLAVSLLEDAVRSHQDGAKDKEIGRLSRELRELRGFCTICKIEYGPLRAKSREPGICVLCLGRRDEEAVCVTDTKARLTNDGYAIWRYDVDNIIDRSEHAHWLESVTILQVDWSVHFKAGLLPREAVAAEEAKRCSSCGYMFTADNPKFIGGRCRDCVTEGD